MRLLPRTLVARLLRVRALAALTALTAAGAFGAASAAAAQDVPSTESAIQMRKNFLQDLDSLQGRFLALAEAIPADKYAWRPGPGVRSIGEVLMHVASEYYLYTPMSYGAAPSPVVGRGQVALEKFESQSTKADAQKHLADGFAYMKQALEGLDPAAITGTKKMFGGDRTILETSLVMSGDLHEHMGQLIAYARMNGIKPPWSK